MIDQIGGPWTATLSPPQYLLTLYFVAVVGLALLAGLVRTWVTQREVGSRYRSATVARLTVAAAAIMSYLGIIVAFRTSYRATGTGFEAGDGSMLVFALRYMDWSVTVPLVTMELLSVCVFAGTTKRRTGVITMAGAVLMIFTGFLGAFVLGGTSRPSVMLLLGGVSGVF